MAAIPKKTFTPRPPDKGSFPLDHEGECRTQMIDYLECLKKNNLDGSICRDFSQRYLKCRMDTQLMAQEEWRTLGFKEPPKSEPPKDTRK